MEEEKNIPQTFSADAWTGESKIFTNMVKKWAITPLSRAKNSKNKWAEWLGRGEREGDKGAKEFCPGWCLQPGQKAPVPPLARLAVGPGRKATYCPGPKGCRDKWPRTNACFVIVSVSQIIPTNIP